MPLQIILALGNYMNSSKRGAVYGFKLQSLDLVGSPSPQLPGTPSFSSHSPDLPPQILLQLLDTKSTDRKMTLLHFIALTVREKYPELATFWQELHFVEKAAAGAPQPVPTVPPRCPGPTQPLTRPVSLQCPWRTCCWM